MPDGLLRNETEKHAQIPGLSPALDYRWELNTY